MMTMRTTKQDEFMNFLMEGITLRQVHEAELRMEVATCIYDAISQCGYTTRMMADKLGVTEDEFALMLSGTEDISPESLCDIERLLGVDLKLPSAMYA